MKSPQPKRLSSRDGLPDERKDTVSSAVISKGVNALPNRYSALEKKISMNTKAITNICEELKGVQIKVKVKNKKNKKNEENVKKKKSLMPGYREERMREDTVGNGPFGYTASETCNEDAREEVFEHFFFQRPLQRTTRILLLWITICISHNNKTMCHSVTLL